MDSTKNAVGGKKMSAKVKGYLILFALVFVSWLIFKILTPDNFGSPENMLSYFQASLIASAGAVGFYFVLVMGMFDFSALVNAAFSSCPLSAPDFWTFCPKVSPYSFFAWVFDAPGFST